MSIKNQISNWNGFRIHGDTSELDKNLEDDIKVVLVTSLSK